MGIYTLKIIRTIDENFIADWKDLWDIGENANIFNSYEWFLMCQEMYKIEDYEIYACYRDTVLVGILPLFPTRCFGVKVQSPLGFNNIVDTSFLIETYDEDIYNYLFSEIISQKNIYIPKIDTKSVEILNKLFPKMFFSLISVNPCIYFNDDPFQYFSKSSLKEIQKIMKTNEKDLEFKIYNQNDNLEKYMKVIFEIEQKSSKKKKSMDLFSHKENRDFFENMTKYCKRFVNIAILYYKNEPISYAFNLKYKNIFSGYQTSYLDEYKKLSPGKTMMTYLIENLKNNSITIFDFGGGISNYKRTFTQKYFLLYNVYYSENPFTMIFWKTINSVRRLKQILLPKKYTRDHEFLFKTFHYTASNKLLTFI